MKKANVKIKWHNEKRKVGELKSFEGNPRQANEKQIKDLDKSLEKFSLASPLVINTDGTVIGGNFRLSREKERGTKEVDVRVPSRNLTRKESEELNLRLNKNQGSWDNEVLTKFSEDLLLDVGWDKDELDEIFGLEIADDFNVEEEFKKAVKNPKGVKKGDLWQLGDHKLMIGDAVNKKCWEKLLGKEKFDFMFTDPPYKLAYAKDIKKRKNKGGFGYKQRRRYIGVEERGGVPEFDEWLSLANEFQNKEGANIMIFENWSNTKELWEAMEKYWKIRNMIIWHTPNRSQGFTRKHQFYQKYDIAPLAGEGKINQEYEEELDDYLQKGGQKLLDTNEIILYGKQGKAYWDKKKGTKWAKINDHITHSVSTEKSTGQNIVFGVKPIQILVPYIKILSPRGGIVMEPFGGSGSTIIASEIMKRKCRAIEITPLYAEVIIRRFEKFTGKEAKKL